MVCDLKTCLLKKLALNLIGNDNLEQCSSLSYIYIYIYIYIYFTSKTVIF